MSQPEWYQPMKLWNQMKILKVHGEKLQDHVFIPFIFNSYIKNNNTKSKSIRSKRNDNLNDPLWIVNTIKYSDLCLRLLLITFKAYFKSRVIHKITWKIRMKISMFIRCLVILVEIQFLQFRPLWLIEINRKNDDRKYLFVQFRTKFLLNSVCF